MKKRNVIILLTALLLFTPVPLGIYKDGGTRDYMALTYRLVIWNRFTEGGGENDTYHKVSVYPFPDNFKNIDELWKIERKGK